MQARLSLSYLQISLVEFTSFSVLLFQLSSNKSLLLISPLCSSKSNPVWNVKLILIIIILCPIHKQSAIFVVLFFTIQNPSRVSTT